VKAQHVDTSEIISGSRWVAVSQLAKQLTQIATLIILANILDPSVFGVLALATIMTRFVDTVVGDLGTAAAIVQRQDLGPPQYSTIFWFNSAVGIGLTVAGALISPWMQPVLGSELAVDVFRVAVLSFAIAGLGMVPLALLRHDLAYSRLVKVDVVVVVVSTGVAVGGAIAGWGVWSLVVSSLCGGVAGTIGAWWQVSFRPTRSFDADHLRSVRSFSTNLSVFRLVNFVSQFADRFLVARVFGDAAGGLYSQSNRLNRVPLEITAVMYRRILFPAMSKMQDNPGRMRSSYKRTVGVVLTAGAPMSVPLIVLAYPLTDAVLGSKWVGVEPLIQIVSVIGLIQLVSNSSGVVLQALGRTDVLLYRGIVIAIILLGGYSIGLTISVEAVAWGYLGAVALLLIPTLEVAFRYIDLSQGEFWWSLRRQLLAIAVQFGATWGALQLLDGGSPWLPLIGASLVGAIAYGATLLVWRDPHLRDLLRIGLPPLERLLYRESSS